MRRSMMVLGAMSASLLSSCNLQSSVPKPGAAQQLASYRDRPELQDADSQAILSRYPDSPGLLV